MRYWTARVGLLAVCFALLVGCGSQGSSDTGSGLSPTQPPSTKQIELPSATREAPSTATIATNGDAAPALPSTMPAEPSPTASANAPVSGKVHPSLIFFTAPG